MPALHVSDTVKNGFLEGSFRVGARNGLIAAGDLTSKAAAKAAVDAAAAKKHVSLQPLAIATKDALDKIDGVVAGATTGSSLTNIYAGIDGTWDNCTSVFS